MIKLYTDGACSGNPGAGGYGYVIVLADKLGKDHEHNPEYWKYDKSYGPVTNNQMEILAVASGLRKVRTDLFLKGEKIKVYSDSKYVIETMLGFWKKKTNFEWWNLLDTEVQKVKSFGASIDWVWLKGHAGDVWNELADQLAVQGVQASKKYAAKEHAVLPYNVIDKDGNKQYLFQNGKWVPYEPGAIV